MLALACAHCSLSAAQDSKKEAAPSPWSSYPVFVWWETQVADRAQAWRILKEAGFNGVNVEASQSSDPAVLAQMHFYVDHLAGKGNLFLRPELIEEERKKIAAGRKDTIRPERPHHFLDPEVKKKLETLVLDGFEVHRRNRPLAWSLDDEISVTTGIAPMDYSFDQRTLNQMRTWLKGVYADLEELNQRWETSFQKIEEILPSTTDEIRARNAGRSLEALNFCSWADHREMMDVLFARSLSSLAAAVLAKEKDLVVGFTGGQAPSAFGGFDWWLLTRSLTFFEAYEHGLAPEIVRFLGKKGARVVRTLFVNKEGRWTVELGVQLWRSIATEEDGAVIWSNARILADEGRSLSNAGESLAGVLKTAREIRASLSPALRRAPEIALYLSQASVRAWWMVDSWGDGQTWPKRLTSYEVEHSTSIQTREAWGQILGAMGLDFGFIDSRELISRGGAETRTKVLVLNETVALSDREIHELVRFAAAGGTLLVDGNFARFDEHLRARDSRGVEALCGLTRDLSSTIDGWSAWRKEGAELGSHGLRRDDHMCALLPDGPAHRHRLGVLRPVGEGRVLFLDVDLRDYGTIEQERGDLARRFREELFRFLVSEAGMSDDVQIDAGDAAPFYRLFRYRQGSDQLLLLVPWRREARQTTAVLKLATKRFVIDELTGGELGDEKKLLIDLHPSRPRLLRVTTRRLARPGEEK